jgi:hypothetical protein
MTAKTTIIAGVAGGYLLGRTKKLRLAATLAGLLAGQRIAGNRQDLLGQGSKLIQGNPQLKQLQEQVSGQLMEVARDAALMAIASRVESATKSLQRRQNGSEDQDAGEAPPEDAEDEYDEPEDEKDSEDQEPEDQEPEDQEPEDEAAPAKKAPAKKAPGKKAAAKKAPVKAAAKKAPAKSAPAKKVPAKKASTPTPAGRGASSRRASASSGAGR